MAVMAPVAMVPAAMMPTTVPVTVMPAPMPVAVVVPAHFFRLDAIDIVLRDDGGFSAGGRGSGLQFSGHWRQRRGLRSCSKRCAARYKTYRYLEKVPTFHDFSPLLG